MRSFMLLALVAVAAAGTREENMRKVQATKWGATVMAQLEMRMSEAHTGPWSDDATAQRDPVGALGDFIDKVKNRILADGKVATDAQNARGKECLSNLEKSNGDIGESVDAIAAEIAFIDAREEEIRQLNAEILAKEKQINDTTNAIAYNKESIALGDTLREENQANFEKATTDAAEVKAAVDKILEIESGSSLHANQNEDDELDATYAARGAMNLDRVANVKALAEVSAHVTDATSSVFLQLAAAAAEATKGNGDVSDLKALLQELLNEVADYLASLEAENKENAADWADLKGKMEAEIVDWEADIVRYNAELQEMQERRTATKQAARAHITTYNEAITTLGTHYRSREATLKQCSDHYDAYLKEAAQRDEQLETLDLIREIIEDKLTNADQVAKRSQDVTSWMTGDAGAAATRCHCDHACGVFDDCCQGCNHKELPDLPPQWDASANSNLAAPVYEGGERELPGGDAAGLYAQYYSGDGGFH